GVAILEQSRPLFQSRSLLYQIIFSELNFLLSAVHHANRSGSELSGPGVREPKAKITNANPRCQFGLLRLHFCSQGLKAFSSPIVVCGPCPGMTIVSSGRAITLRRSDSIISSNEPPHRSVRPMPRINNVSPENNFASSPGA